MCVNCPAAVVIGRVIIRMRVYERNAQGRSQDGQGEREGCDLPQDVSLFVTTGTASRAGLGAPPAESLIFRQNSRFRRSQPFLSRGPAHIWIGLRAGLRSESPCFNGVILMRESTMSDLPIACTLGPAALKARREDLLGGLVRRAEQRLDIADGYRVRFAPDDGLLPTIAAVVNVERQCCRFLRFHVTVEPDGGPIWLEFTGPPGTREFLDGMLDL